MTSRGKIAAGGAAVGLLLWWLTGSFLITLAVLVGVPAIAYLVLDPSQRRRVRRVARREIGR